VRVVWHFRAHAETRRFQLAYRLVNRTIAYADAADARVPAWGSHWSTTLDRLRVTLRLPPGDRAGSTASLGGEALALDHGRFTGTLDRIAPGTEVTLLARVPATLLSSKAGAVLRPGRAPANPGPAGAAPAASIGAREPGPAETVAAPGPAAAGRDGVLDAGDTVQGLALVAVLAIVAAAIVVVVVNTAGGARRRSRGGRTL
jgi:hypothetical protein